MARTTRQWETKTGDTGLDDDFEKFTANLVIGLTLAGILFLVATARPATGPTQYSALYLKQNGYQNYIAADKTWFTYVIENHEADDQTYEVTVSVQGEVRENKQVPVAKGGKFEELVELPVRESGLALPAKVMVVAIVGDKEYEAYYWLKPRPPESGGQGTGSG